MARQPGEYARLATQYALDVVEGREVACKWVKLACQRQLDDLQRAAGCEPGSWFEFNVERAERPCRFIENLPQIEGQWRGQPLLLQPWQLFRITTVFGWVDSDGWRRYHTAYSEEARKNGKTTEAAGVGLYLVTADGEGAAQVYSAATTRDQAKLCWNLAKSMQRDSPGLRKRFGVKSSAGSIYVPSTDSLFKPLSSDHDTLDGLNISGAVVDELHAHKSRGVWDVITSGTSARRQPLVWAITTAGTNQAGVCFEQHTYTKKLLEGVIEDDRYFGIIYTLDDEDEIAGTPADDWTDPACWKKANPNLGVSCYEMDLAKQVQVAKNSAASRNGVLTKRFNIWVNADTAWLDMRLYERIHRQPYVWDDFAGYDVIGAADLASKIDIAAVAWLFEEQDKLYPFLDYFLPDETVREGVNDMYQGWWNDGLLRVTTGNIIDFDAIEDRLVNVASFAQVKEFGYDPHQATQFAGHMLEEGFPMVEVRPTVLNFSEPMKELEARIRAQTFFTKCPIFRWMVSNVVCHTDAKDNIYPRKPNAAAKIDGVIAVLMCLNRYMQPEKESSIYNRRGLTVVG